jgi:hypothetical protein
LPRRRSLARPIRKRSPSLAIIEQTLAELTIAVGGNVYVGFDGD